MLFSSANHLPPSLSPLHPPLPHLLHRVTPSINLLLALPPGLLPATSNLSTCRCNQCPSSLHVRQSSLMQFSLLTPTEKLNTLSVKSLHWLIAWLFTLYQHQPYKIPTLPQWASSTCASLPAACFPASVLQTSLGMLSNGAAVSWILYSESKARGGGQTLTSASVTQNRDCRPHLHRNQ